MNESKVLPLTVVFSVFVVTIPGVNENTCEELPGGKCEVGAFTALTSTGYDGGALIVDDTMAGDVITYVIDRRTFPSEPADPTSGSIAWPKLGTWPSK